MEPTLDSIRLRYQHFAEFEAKESSPLYAELAHGISQSEQSEPALRFIASLPAQKQQPNLVFAAVRQLCGTPESFMQFTQMLHGQPDAVRELILARRTQTNEPGRCATLLPALGQLPQPLALIEVGASAGLCLLPDLYGYDYGHSYGQTQLRPEPAHDRNTTTPVFPCQASEATPIPDKLPSIAFRAGLDLNPMNLSNPQDANWLETLVWPGQESRAQRLRAAIEIAQTNPVSVTKGDLLVDLPALLSSAPTDATPVVFHSAVLAYVTAKDRDKFVEMMRDLKCVWISNEGPEVFPDIAAKMTSPAPQNRFVLAVDGEPVAITGPHGQSIEWIA